MNKSLNPLVALLILLFFAGLIGLNFFCNQRMMEVERPTFMASAPDGRLAIQLGRELFLIDRDSGDETVVDLAALGFGDNIGNFDFFANGDVLLRTGNRLRSLLEEIEATARFGNDSYTAASDNALSRCSVEWQECQQFSIHLPGFDRAFRVFIDRVSDTVYLADTSRHRILKLDGNGQLLAFREGFKFPNQISLVENQLWVTDTNNHRLVAVSMETDSFGEEISEITVRPDNQHIWPSAFAKVNGEWWVLAMGDNMSDGIIVRYTSEGTEVGQLNLPRNADPLSMGLFGDEVLVTDHRNFAVYRYNLHGGRLVDFSSPRLSQTLAGKKAASVRWQYYGYSCWGVFALAVLIGFALAFRQQRQVDEERDSVGFVSEDTPEAVPDKGIWIEATRRAKWAPMVLVVIFLLILGTLIPVILSVKKFPWEIVLISSSMAISMLLLCLPLRRLSKTRIGVFEGRIELVDHEERRHWSPYAEILWHKAGVFKVGEYVLPTGNRRQQGVFPRKELDRWVIPRLLPENKVGAWTMMKYQWHSPDGMMRSMTLMLLVLGGLSLYLERESFLAWLQSLS
ncbi:NHL repeat-containing protein [Porticoccus sp.]